MLKINVIGGSKVTLFLLEPRPPAGVSMLLKVEDSSTTQSSSICAVRWHLPEESVQAHSSAPSRAAEPNSLTRPSQVHHVFLIYFKFRYLLYFYPQSE